MRLLSVVVLAGCFVAAGACGDQLWTFDLPTDGGSDACVGDACAPACSAPQVECDGGCVDPSTDDKACGVCGIQCGDGERCRDGLCECLPSRERCGVACVSWVNDPAHCGGCDLRCAEGLLCRGGECR